jgi:hypothetical protein
MLLLSYRLGTATDDWLLRRKSSHPYFDALNILLLDCSIQRFV